MLLLRLYRQLLTIRDTLKLGSENPEICIRDFLMSYQGIPYMDFEKPELSDDVFHLTMVRGRGRC